MHKTKIMMLALALSAPGYGQSVFNCPTFNSGIGTCGANTSSSGPFKIIGGHGSVTSSGQLQLAPASTSHTALAANYTTPVNVQAFTTTYTFIPSGNVLAFVLQNVNNQQGYQGIFFVAGAGCEGGFFQASNAGVGGQSPNNVFALTMDGFNWLTPAYPGNGFEYSGTALYHSEQDPCKPNDGDPVYNPVNNISTSPVSLNAPANSPNTTTGHTYSVNITYDGSNLTENLFDVTAGGACPGASCFTHTWSGVNIPAIVGGSNTALTGITASTVSAGNAGAVLINSWSYTQGSPTPPPQPTLASIAVTPINLSMLVGVTQQYTATCTKSDATMANCTSSVTWSSSDTSKALVSVSGLASGMAAGSAVIAATSGTVKGTSTLTVTAPPPPVLTMTYIAVNPAGTSLVVGSTLQYAALCGWSDSSQTNCTANANWTSSSRAKFTITTGGLATGVSSGAAMVNARIGNFQGCTNINVKSKTKKER